METISYLRVSTTYQDLEKNKSDILKLANEKGLGYVEWVEEKISTRVSWHKRPNRQPRKHENHRRRRFGGCSGKQRLQTAA